MSNWWVTCNGVTQGAGPAGSEEVGPYATEAAARKAFSQGVRPAGCGGQGSPGAAPTDCAWFMVPPSIWQQILHGITSIGSPSFDIATATYACGSKAATLRNAGYQAFASKAAAEASVNQANQNANQPPNALAGVSDFFSRLTEANTWIRVAEVLIGVVLLGVGLARITGAQNAVSSIVKARIP